jgi:putative endopeptidase
MNKKILLAGIVLAGISTACMITAKLKGVDIASMDKKAEPRDDFYQYANGTWCKENIVPAAEARWTSFNVLAEKNNLLLKKILEDAAADSNALPGSNNRKIGNFYRAAMDTLRINEEGATPVMADMFTINKMKVNNEIITLVADLHKKGIPAMFNFDVSQDLKNSNRNIIYLSQGGLGLPDKDYYIKDDEKSAGIRNEYRFFMLRLFREFTVPPNPKSAESIVSIETTLAKASMTRVERRNPEKTYNKRTVKELAHEYKHINFVEYFNHLNIQVDSNTEVILGQPLFFTELDQALENTPNDNWKAYLKWKVMCATAKYLSSNIASESFGFYGTILNGTKQQKPRWQRVVESANNLIGDIVSQEYVKVAFSADSKKRVNDMVDNLREAFKIRIDKLDWMSKTTKGKAIEKLNAFNRKLGYPDKWKNTHNLKMLENSYLTNFYNASQFDFNEMVGKLQKRVDKTEWEMLPQTVNAYYNPANNEIVFPAAIMQPPFFNTEADDAVNYGAIGAVIGHEFSHGFDDQGCKFDAIGNMNNWWTDEDKVKFEDRTKKLVDQYNKFAVEDKVFVNGELTLGENIADFGGLTIAYDAYQISLKGKKRKSIKGFTPEQRFFIGFAQVWKNNSRPEYSRQQVMTDPHSPGKFRVIGPLSNMPEFYAAFKVKKGDKMFIDEVDRAVIW